MKLVERFSLWLPAIFILALLAWLAKTGADRLSFGFLYEVPSYDGLSGGIGPILANTFLIVGWALLLCIPLALAASIAYVFTQASGSGALNCGGVWFRRILDLGLCLPRLLWGLSGAALFGYLLGFGVSATTGILTLAALLVPFVTSGFIEGLSGTTHRYRDVCAAMGYTEQQMIMKVAFPAAWPSLKISILLATGRAFGDAAALILTAGIGKMFILSWEMEGATLAVYIYTMADQAGGGLPTTSAAALVLLLLTAAIQIPFVSSHR
jgi:phosphate transport system permease protein